MELGTYVTHLREQLAVAADAGGDEARELAARLTAPLEAAIRLVLLDALSTAADEITRELAPGAVELRLRGGEPEFVVYLPPAEDEFTDMGSRPHMHVPTPAEIEEGGPARLNLRLPDTLKQRIEDAAGAEGLSLNAWLIRAAGAALDTGFGRRGASGGDKYTGWVR
jgi:hypothetical protein